MSRLTLGALLIIASASAQPTFKSEGPAFTFDTGALRGTLHAGGKSTGLIPVTSAATTSAVARFMGLLSPYRLLTADRRFGDGAWDWASVATLQDDGAVRVAWTADAAHPLDMSGIYRWASSNMLDLTLTVTPHEPLRKFEVFVASYFEGFPVASAWTREGFIEARKADSTWHMFPRDADGASIITDGRWKLPPHPVDWAIRPEFAGALAVRRDALRGLTGLVMAPTQDCFAVAMPYGEEAHRSLYVCLLGRDLAQGESAIVHARLILAPGLSDEDAIAAYRRYQQEIAR